MIGLILAAAMTAAPMYRVEYVCTNDPKAPALEITPDRVVRVTHCPDAPEPDPVFRSGFE
jgi:hypothetical protein